MSDQTDETQQTPAATGGPEGAPQGPVPAGPASTKKAPWGRLLIAGWLVLIAIAVLGGYTGYQSGIEHRLATQSAQGAEELDHQYQLGLEELLTQECDRARQRFEWILEQDPNYPGAIDSLAQAITCMNATATPTPELPTPTPTLTPTPDFRTVEEKFNQAQASMEAGDWEAAINSLFALRKEDPAYKAVDVDSMLYVAFRNRGVDKILNLGELESGLYDLSQAELFGPLDSEANGYRDWARLYLIGVSFYSVSDWAQAAFYLGQVAPYAPNLHNGTSGFAMDWYLESLEKYITQLDEAKDWCTAVTQLELYIQLTGDSSLEDQLNRYINRCEEDQNG